MIFSLKRFLNIFIFCVISFLFISVFSCKALAFDVATSPSPLPEFPYIDEDFTAENVYSFTRTFEVPIYSSDNIQVGVYNMEFFSRVGYSVNNSNRKTQAIVGFSFPSEFFINGFTFKRDMLDIMQMFYNNSSDNGEVGNIYIPLSSVINSSNGWTVNKGITTNYNGSYFALRPAGYSQIDDQYYFYVRLDTPLLLRASRNSGVSSSMDIVSPFVTGSSVYSIFTNCLYNNGVFMDSVRYSGYSSRTHNSYTSPGWAGLFYRSLLQASLAFSDNVSYGTIPFDFGFEDFYTFKLTLPYDYVTLSSNGSLEALQSIVNDIAELKVSLSEIHNFVSDISLDVDYLKRSSSYLNTFLPVFNENISSINSLLNSISSKIDNLSGNSKDYTAALSRLEASLNNLVRIFENFSVDDLSSILQALDTSVSNLDQMMTDFVEVSSEALSEFNASLTKLDNASQKLVDLANRLTVEQPEVDVDVVIDNIIPSDFDLSVSWIGNVFSFPLVLTLVSVVFSLGLISYVFFGKKA